MENQPYYGYLNPAPPPAYRPRPGGQ
jgi:hypothetical protein